MSANTRCRICGSASLTTYLDLGNLALTGFFPKPHETVPFEPLALAQCNECGLSQLRDKMPIKELYGPQYGYESNLNASMSLHLKTLAAKLQDFVKLAPEDSVLDIASNDGTLLSGYRNKDVKKFGVDPLIDYLPDRYPRETTKISTFFDAGIFKEVTKCRPKIITSCSVFYDLDDPSQFVSDIASVMDEEGIWVLEQSYFYQMVDRLGFDTICHEHLLYLRLTDLQTLAEQSQLEIFDVLINDVNGGSFQVFIQRKSGKYPVSGRVSELLLAEKERATNMEDIGALSRRVTEYSNKALSLIEDYKKKGFEIIGLGASTKGNVLLQVLGLSQSDVNRIGEVNPRKFGRVTPGTGIPIVSEEEIFSQKSKRPKLAIVLPWHFKDSFLELQKRHGSENLKLFFPLPFEPRVV